MDLLHELTMKAAKTGIPAFVRWVGEKIGLPQILDTVLPWDEDRCKLPPSQRILALIMTILFDRKALYKVHQAFDDQDVELLFGHGVEAEDLNDDCLARALDKLHAANPAKVFTTVAATALSRVGVDWSTLQSVHFDTTSISVYGAYEAEESQESVPGAVNITFGFSKDGHPELKQFMLGILATKDGIPLFGQVLDGNASDKVVNAQVLEAIRQQLPAETLQRLLYVADSQLLTLGNLRKMQELKLRFVARAPATFGWVEKVKEDAWQRDAWREVGTLSPRRDAARYWVSETEQVIEDTSYRAIIVRSTSLDQRKEKALRQHVDRERTRLQQGLQAMGKRTFACRQDAEAALAALVTEEAPRFWRVDSRIEEDVERLPQGRRGRPRKDEPPVTTTVYRVHGELTYQPEAFDLAFQRAATFVLLTNDTTLDAAELLKEYKEQQTAVEIPFHVIKSLPLAPVFLKKPHRVEAFAWVALLAYLVYAITQHLARKVLEEAQETLVTPGNRVEKTPTARSLFEMLATIYTIRVYLQGILSHRQFYAADRHVHKFLALVGCPLTIFTDVPIPSG